MSSEIVTYRMLSTTVPVASSVTGSATADMWRALFFTLKAGWVGTNALANKTKDKAVMAFRNCILIFGVSRSYANSNSCCRIVMCRPTQKNQLSRTFFFRGYARKQTSWEKIHVIGEFASTVEFCSNTSISVLFVRMHPHTCARKKHVPDGMTSPRPRPNLTHEGNVALYPSYDMIM